METLINVAFFVARQGRTEDLGESLLALVAPTRTEEGCQRYEIFQSSDDRDQWMVHEAWRSRADFDAHMRTPYVAGFMARVPELCREDVEICAYAQRA